MKWAFYNVLFAIVYPFLLPGFLVRMLRRGGYAARMGDRFALYPPEVMAQFVPDGKPVCPHGKSAKPSNFVWIHAVSVGEVQVAGQLMREWRKVEPGVRFCFSTTSSTGWMMAQRELASLPPTSDLQPSTSDVLIYNPLDFPNFVKSALKTVRPRAIVLTESEIWPNFILTAKRYGIPLFLINARVSDRSAPCYRKARFFFGDALSAFTRIFAQSELDKRRLVDAGAPSDRVEVTGSFKFDVARRNEAKEKELREWIGPGRILLGGSTWPGEDEALLRIYRAILNRNLQPQPLLVLAPRHFEKADAVEANIQKAGFSCIRRSRGETSHTSQTSHTSHPPVYLCDTTGEMMGLFGICDAAFVGKSLCARGSQNMIEPCLCGKPTVVGPHTENFRPVMSDLTESRAIVQVADERGLADTIVGWFEKGDSGLGERAKVAVARRCGVVRRCVASVLSALAIGCSREAPPVEAPKAEPKPAAEVSEAPKDLRKITLVREVVVTAQCIADCMGGVTGGLNTVRIDARELDCNGFFNALRKVPGDAIVWMPGENDWLVTWPGDGRPVRIADMMDRYAALENIDELARSGCDSVSSLFASYVGTVNSVMPAFAGLDPTVHAAPELFVAREVPPLAGFSFDGIDEDIRKSFLDTYRECQLVRRRILEGNVISHGDAPDAAVEIWAEAAKRNADDPMMAERVGHLMSNAEVFFKLGKYAMAARCYETVAQIRPDDPVPVFNYGVSVEKLGKYELADRAYDRANMLDGRRK